MEFKTILVPFDFGEPAQRALDHARAIADRFGSSIVLLHVMPDPYMPNPYMPLSPEVAAAFIPRDDVVKSHVAEAERTLLDLVAPDEREKFHVRSVVRLGDPRAVILDEAAKSGADLIVMGTHGRTGALAHLFLGSVAERTVRQAPCPVLTVR